MAEDGSSRWAGLDESISDPEEARAIYTALDSFVQYAKTAHFNCTHQRRRAFYALPQSQWKMLAAPPFNYLETLERVDAAIDSNADLGRAITSSGLRSFGSPDTLAADSEPQLPKHWCGISKPDDIDKARSTIRQFFRDWSAEGKSERDACYGPVLRALEAERNARGPDAEQLKVLVPGAGLGRLVFDLCLNGFSAEGNEISYHQLLASSYILNHCDRAGKHTIFPWVHTFSNHRTRANQLRGYSVPDIHCATELTEAGKHRPTGEMSMVAADFLCLYSDEEHADLFDAVATVFFLDTAPNLIRYLETIFHCLKPGGVLINIGPLLWHFENHAPGSHGNDHGYDGDADNDGDTSGIEAPGSFELSDDEVMALVARVGFAVEEGETGIEAPYIHDTESMIKTVYQASSWVARKPATKGCGHAP